MRLETITMPDFSKAKDYIVLIPFGSIEEHGPHLPLGTDAIIAYELSLAASEGKEIIVSPPVYYGVCRSTKQHPGTITISENALRILAKDIVLGFIRHGFKRFILFSGHAGGTHMASLLEVGEGILECPEIDCIAIVSIFDLIGKDIPVETKNDGHAGELETSLILYLHPEWVKDGAFEDYPKFPKPILVKNKLDYWKSGIWGDPTKASKEKGERFFMYLAEKFKEIIEKVEKFGGGRDE